jgi:hypothetical protein
LECGALSPLWLLCGLFPVRADGQANHAARCARHFETESGDKSPHSKVPPQFGGFRLHIRTHRVHTIYIVPPV